MPAKVEPPFCPTQTEDTIVLLLREQWKCSSASPPCKPAFLVNVLHSATSLGQVSLFHSLQTHQLLLSLALHLPSFLQGPTFLPHTGRRGRGVGTLAAHSALELFLDLLSSHQPAPNRCQSSTAAPSVL